MAVLDVKKLPDGLYRKLKARAKRERRSVSQEVVVLVAQVLEPGPPVSLLDWRGLGKERWRGGDAGWHVENERKAWR